CPIVVSGWRECRVGDRTAPGRVRGRTVGPVEHRLVLARRSDRDDRVICHRSVVRAPPFDREGAAARGARYRSGGTVTGPRRGGRRHPTLAGLLEILLPGQFEQLLHVLPDRPVRCVRADRPDLPLRFPGFGGGRHTGWWAGRRPDRIQGRDLGVDPWGPAVY